MRRIVLFALGLLLVPSVYAQGAFDAAADSILAFLTNDNMIALFGILFTFVLIYTAFMAAIRNVPFFKKGENITPQGKMFALSLSLIGTLGMFTANVITNGAPLDTARRIMEIGGIFGITALAIVLFLLTFKGFQTDKNDTSMARGLAAAGLAFLFVGMLTARPGYLSWGWLFAIIAVVFYVYKLFIPGGFGKKKDTVDKPDAPKPDASTTPSPQQQARDAQQDARQDMHQLIQFYQWHHHKFYSAIHDLGVIRKFNNISDESAWKWHHGGGTVEDSNITKEEEVKILAKVLDDLRNLDASVLQYMIDVQDRAQGLLQHQNLKEGIAEELNQTVDHIADIGSLSKHREIVSAYLPKFFTALIEIYKKTNVVLQDEVNKIMQGDKGYNIAIKQAGINLGAWSSSADISDPHDKNVSVVSVNVLLDKLRDNVGHSQSKLTELKHSVEKTVDLLMEALRQR